MYKIRSKKFTILLTLIFVLGIMLPLAGPASAVSVNSVDRLVAVGSDYNGVLGNTLTLQEDSNFITHFQAGQSFRVTLPSPMKWNAAATVVSISSAAGVDTFTGTNKLLVSDQTLELTIPAVTNRNAAQQEFITIAPSIDVNGAVGDITVTIDARDSAITGGVIIIGRAGAAAGIVVAESVKNIGEVGDRKSVV